MTLRRKKLPILSLSRNRQYIKKGDNFGRGGARACLPFLLHFGKRCCVNAKFLFISHASSRAGAARNDMEKLTKLILCVSLTLLCAVSLRGQTAFYKRTKIVNNGVQTPCNDDGHYITFTSSRAYDSDKDGYQLYGSNMKYSKTENDIKVYYGESYHGTCNWFTSLDNSRINVRLPDGKIYVYERCSPSSSVARRAAPQKSGAASPSTVVPTTPTYDNSYGTTTPSSSRKQRKTCPYCKGSGIGMDKITYAPGYDEVWCDRCGKWGFKHYHQDMMCRTCYGKGYIEY